MAKPGTTEVEVSNGSPTPDGPGADAFELELPEGMDAESFERAIQAPKEEEAAKATDKQPEATTKPAEIPAATTSVPAVEKPATTTVPAKGSTGKALAAERQKSKDLRAENQRLRAKWKEIEDERSVGMKNMQGAPPPIQVRVEKPKHEPIVQTATEAEARGESALPKVIEGALTEMQRVQQKAMQELADSLDARVIQRQERELAEDLQEDTGENLTEILTKGGIYAAITRDAQGNYADPVVAKRVYGSANPAKAALRLARAKIASLEPEVEDVEVAVETPVVEKPAVKAPTPDAIAAAKREGAREVAETVAGTAAKPRGVRVFTSAGAAPQVGKSPEFWDSLNRMMDSNPDGFVSFMDKNPAISTWFDRGRPKS